MKKEIDKLNAIPSKRIFHSIIADYDLNRSICELVDNGLDVWVRGKRAKAISIGLNLDKRQQAIIVEDNAGRPRPPKDEWDASELQMENQWKEEGCATRPAKSGEHSLGATFLRDEKKFDTTRRGARFAVTNCLHSFGEYFGTL